MSQQELFALIDLMRINCLTSLSVGGVALSMDPRGFVLAAPVQTMTIPPQEPSPLFRPLTDEELLTAHLPPENDQ